MSTLSERELYFLKRRDFGKLLNDFFAFSRSHFLPIAKSLLLIAGPLVLISTIVTSFFSTEIGFLFSRFMSYVEGFQYRPDEIISGALVYYLLYSVVSLLSSIAMIVVVSSYLKLHIKGENTITPKMVWQFILQRKYALFLLSFSVIIIYLAALMVGFLMAYGIGSYGRAAMIFAMIFYYFGILIFMFPLSYLFPSLFFVQIHENKPLISTFKRALSLLRKNFWFTWLVFFVSSIVFLIVTTILLMPHYFVTFLQELMSSTIEERESFEIALLVTSLIGTFLSSLAYGFYYLLCGFHFFNLKERKDKTGVIDKINLIGKKEEVVLEETY